MKGPSAYETKSLNAIREWKNPHVTLWRKAIKAAAWPLDKSGKLLLSVPGVGWVIEKSLVGILSLGNDLAQRTVRPNAVLAEYRRKGNPSVLSLKDILTLDLCDVDSAIGWLAAKYKVLASTEGAGAGVVGLFGIPADVFALSSLCLRAVGEYATYCGFDVRMQHERLYAMSVLGFASSPNDAAKSAALTQLAKIAKDAAQKKTWAELESHAFVRTLRQVADLLSIRLTKAKLSEIVPVVGAVVGGGYNAYYTSKVCDAAYHLYRERFLLSKYGSFEI